MDRMGSGELRRDRVARFGVARERLPGTGVRTVVSLLSFALVRRSRNEYLGYVVARTSYGRGILSPGRARRTSPPPPVRSESGSPYLGEAPRDRTIDAPRGADALAPPGHPEQGSSRDARSPALRTALLACLALIAFSMNSILGRLALGAGAIDPLSFSLVRLGSGAVVLAAIAAARSRDAAAPTRRSGGWVSALFLVLYAIPFSYAYLDLDAGTGALLLFGAVQATMLARALAIGERPGARAWLGLLIALAGLAYLVFPGVTAPDPFGAMLMVIAGIAWGVYTLRGRGAHAPLRTTTRSFVLSVPIVVAVGAGLLAAGVEAAVSWRGIGLAALSGAVTSGLGYAIWYAALAGMTATRAATIQLSVPVIAAGGGVLLLGEQVTLRLVLASVAILGGIGFTLVGRRR